MPIQLFDETEALKTVDEIAGKVGRQAYESIQTILEETLQRALVVAPVIDPSRVVFRAKTLQILLDAVRDEIGADSHARLLRMIGEETGESFGHVLVKTFAEKQRLPRTYKALLVTWTIFDESARWGKITVDFFDEARKIADIRIDNSFLTTGYEENKHRHCSFFEGYIRGVVNQAFMEWARSMRGMQPFSSKPLVCHLITESQRDGVCLFSAEFGEEQLSEARDMLLRAMDNLDNKRWKESIDATRTTLEMALRDKVGWVEKRFSFTRCLKALPRAGAALPSFDRALRFYSLASEVQHGDRTPTVEDSYRISVFARRFICELEELSLSDGQRADVRNIAKKSREQ